MTDEGDGRDRLGATQGSGVADASEAHQEPRERATRLTRRGQVVVAAGAAALVALVAVIGVGLSGGSEPERSAQPATQAAAPAPTTSGPTSGSPTTNASGTATPGGTPAMPTTVPRSGTGRTAVLTPPSPNTTPNSTPTASTGRTVRYTLEIEGGLGIPADHFAATAQQVLTDRRGWQTQDHVRFVDVGAEQRAAGAATDIRIILGSPDYVDRGCRPLETMGRLSCNAGEKVLLNAERWAHGAETYGDDVATYRIYLVSHEVGHALGHDHRSCPEPGANAPVMVQQTKSLFGCRPWPWPVYSEHGD